MALNERLRTETQAAQGVGTATLCCQAAQEAEERGDFQAARESLSLYWERVGERPNVEGLELSEQADVLLRVGTLTGKIGSAQQIPGAQELAKDLIGEGIGIFERLGLDARVAEARTNLAYCYLREARFDEARIILSNALGMLAPEEYELKIRALVLSGIVEKGAKRLYDALAAHGQSSIIIQHISNEHLLGIYHSEHATVLKNLGLAERRQEYIDRAFIEFTAAAYFFERIGNKRYGAAVENNTGGLYLGISDFVKAHEHFDRARALYTTLNDTARIAQVDENRARAYIGQNNPLKALKIIKAAVRALESGDEAGVLAEALITYGVCLARTNSHKQAGATFVRAACLAMEAGDREGSGRAWLAMLEELPELEAGHNLGAYNAAYSLLSASQDSAIKGRLLAAAHGVISKMGADKKGVEAESDALPEGFTLARGKKEFEKECVRKALKATNGNAYQASKLLGLTHHQRIYQLIKEHNIANPEGRKRLKSLMISERSNVEMIGEMLEIELPDNLKGLPLVTHTITNEALAFLGIHAGDEIVVWQTSDFGEGDAVAVHIPGHPYLAGLLRYEGECFRLECDDEETASKSFRKSDASFEGKIVGFCKKVAGESPRPTAALKFHPLP